jgi:hypothetical protein
MALAAAVNAEKGSIRYQLARASDSRGHRQQEPWNGPNLCPIPTMVSMYWVCVWRALFPQLLQAHIHRA